MSTQPSPLVSHLPPLAASAKFEQTNPMMGTLYTRFTQPKMRAMLTQPGLDADVLYLAHCELKFTSKYAYAVMGARDAYKSLRRDMWDRYKQLTTDKKQAETASFHFAPPALPITPLGDLPADGAPVATLSDALEHNLDALEQAFAARAQLAHDASPAHRDDLDVGISYQEERIDRIEAGLARALGETPGVSTEQGQARLRRDVLRRRRELAQLGVCVSAEDWFMRIVDPPTMQGAIKSAVYALEDQLHADLCRLAQWTAAPLPPSPQASMARLQDKVRQHQDTMFGIGMQISQASLDAGRAGPGGPPGEMPSLLAQMRHAQSLHAHDDALLHIARNTEALAFDVKKIESNLYGLQCVQGRAVDFGKAEMVHAIQRKINANEHKYDTALRSLALARHLPPPQPTPKSVAPLVAFVPDTPNLALHPRPQSSAEAAPGVSDAVRQALDPDHCVPLHPGSSEYRTHVRYMRNSSSDPYRAERARGILTLNGIPWDGGHYIPGLATRDVRNNTNGGYVRRHTMPFLQKGFPNDASEVAQKPGPNGRTTLVWAAGVVPHD